MTTLYSNNTDTFLPDLETAFNLEYDNQAVAQFTRQGQTSKWFNPRGQTFHGKGYVHRAIVAPSNPTRRTGYAAGRTGQWPVARDMAFKAMQFNVTDLCEIKGRIKFNELDEKRATSAEYSIERLAFRLAQEMEADHSSQLNAMIHQGANPVIGTIAAITNLDGTGLTASNKVAFIKMTDGQISQFAPGDVIEIADATSTGGSDQLNMYAVVADLYPGKYGPPYFTTGVRSAIGPGIVIYPLLSPTGSIDISGCTAAATNSNTNVGTVTAAVAAVSGGGTPAIGDFIARSGEFSTGTKTSIHGLPDWFNPLVSVYHPESAPATDLDRTLPGNSWMNPTVIDPAAGGAAVTFDMDRDFGQLGAELSHRVQIGRNRRLSEGVSMSGDSMVFFTTGEIATEATQDAKQYQRFTQVAAGTLDKAQATKLFGSVGFEGTVFHSAVLPPIAIQPDIACTPNRGYLIDPSSFFYVTLGDSPKSLTWLQDGGQKFWMVKNENDNGPSHFREGAAYAHIGLTCDCPSVNAMIKGIKDSNS